MTDNKVSSSFRSAPEPSIHIECIPYVCTYIHTYRHRRILMHMHLLAICKYLGWNLSMLRIGWFERHFQSHSCLPENKGHVLIDMLVFIQDECQMLCNFLLARSRAQRFHRRTYRFAHTHTLKQSSGHVSYEHHTMNSPMCALRMLVRDFRILQ
jgi:hypothetical protein